MNTKIYFRITLLISIIILTLCSQTANAQIAIVRAWAAYAGNTDSTFKSPIVNDEDYSYVTTLKSDSVSGVDILIVKYDKEGHTIWAQTWSGPGNGRDQASDMAQDDSSLYICGITFTSSVNNFDFVTLRVDKEGGAIRWATTFNGSASTYDVATAIDVNNDAVYVTGTTNSAGTSLDYLTIKYNKTTGTEIWHQAFDYNGLMDIPFDIEIKDSANIVVTGGSQNSITDWDYQTIEYDDSGNIVVQSRASGTGAGFDRAQSAKSDGEGNIYVTGATVNNSNYDIETVKITPAGTIAWVDKKDFNAEDDIGNDLIVDRMGNVYVCGQSKNSGSNEFIVLKLDSTGYEQWSTRIGQGGREFIAIKMCFDSWGNIIATGSSPNPNDCGNTDFFTVGFDTDGNEIWRDNYDGPDHGNDKASDITADANGNIFVTGQAWISSELQTVTIRYRTDYYTEPALVDTPSAAYLFYPNSGQVIDDRDSATVDSVHYYTLHHYPQLYFGYGVMNMVWTHIDLDTATQDTMQRVDVSFLNSSNVTEAYPVDEQDSAGYLNYYLPQCPEGITNVYGYSKLLYTDVYPGINAMYTSNNAGLKFYFICAPNCDNPNQIGLLFQGQDSISINQNWELEVNTALGNYIFEKPRVYLLDNNNNVTSLSWHLNWSLTTTDQAQFSGWGSYDANQTLVIEISRLAIQLNTNCNNNLCWSTYLGSTDADKGYALTKDKDEKVIEVGFTKSQTFPQAIHSTIQFSQHGNKDAFIIKFKPISSISTGSNIEWATYYGGSEDDVANGVVTNAINDIYITGFTQSSNYKWQTSTNNPSHSTFEQHTLNNNNSTSGQDAFILRINSSGNIILWSAFIGGEGVEEANDVLVNSNDDVYVVGFVRKNDPSDYFPTHDDLSSSTDYYQGSICADLQDAFIMRFDKYDVLNHSTLFGGDGADLFSSICLLNNDQVAITGTTSSSSGVAISPPGSSNTNDLFPVCSTAGNTTFLNNSGETDALIVVFDDDNQLQYSTFFGGSDVENGHWDPSHYFADMTNGKIASTDPPSNQYVVIGTTISNGTPGKIPVHNSGGANTYYQPDLAPNALMVVPDLFFARFNNNHLEHCSYFGGGGVDNAGDVLFTPDGSYFICGSTKSSTPCPNICTVPQSSEFPMCYNVANNDYFDNVYHGFGEDGFISRYNASDELIWSTYIGGSSGTGSAEIREIINSLAYAPYQAANYLYFGGYTDAAGVPTDFPQIQIPNFYNQIYNSGMTGVSPNLDAIIGRFELHQIVIGVQEFDINATSFLVYPNPVGNVLYIKSSCLLNKDDDLSVSNIIGKGIKKFNNFRKEANGLYSIDITDLANGMYFLNCKNNNIPTYVKFIKE